MFVYCHYHKYYLFYTIFIIADDDDKSSNVSDSEYESAENVAEELSNEENKYEEKEDYNSDSATEEDNENEENGDDQIENDANPGWADCMAKILKTKKSDNKSAVVLSKARKITDIKKKQKETADFEIVQSGEKRSAIDDLDKKLGPDNEEEPISKKVTINFFLNQFQLFGNKMYL